MASSKKGKGKVVMEKWEPWDTKLTPVIEFSSSDGSESSEDHVESDSYTSEETEDTDPICTCSSYRKGKGKVVMQKWESWDTKLTPVIEFSTSSDSDESDGSESDVLSDSLQSERVEENNKLIPIFSVQVTKGQLHKSQTLPIPGNVRRELLKVGQQFVMVKEKGKGAKKWEIKWNFERNNYCAFGKGWYGFCADHCLRVGDEITFERKPNSGSWIVSVKKRR